MKKNILFAAYSLDIGGIETALVTLINTLAEEEYDITLVLEKKEGIFLNDINEKINIIEYTPYYCKNRLISKVKNAINRCKFIAKYRNKFDCSISYATYSLSSSFVARTASKNSALWVHNNYLKFFDNNENEYLKFFKSLNVESFKKIIFVSEESKKDFEQRFKNLKDRLIVCNNLIDYNKIISKSEEKTANQKEELITNKKADTYTFLNIGRHDEKQKKLSRLIEASKKLYDDGYKFKVVLVGDGENHKEYIEHVKRLNLQDQIVFKGGVKNPYPYYKQCDSVILTSDFEGYPVVYVEALTLGKTIITTDVSDSIKDIDGKYGIVCKKNVDDIYEKMKYVIENGYKIKQRFNPEKFNDDIKKKVKNIICEEDYDKN